MTRTILYSICAIAGAVAAWMLATETISTVAILREWKPRPVMVWGTQDGRSYEVKWGDDREFSANVAVSPLTIYSSLSPHVLYENPANAEQKQLDGLLDLWYLPITWLTALLLAVASGYIVSRVSLGEDREWSVGAWVETAQELPPISPTIALVRPPKEAWKAKLFWGCVIGLPLFLGGLYSFSSSLLAGIVTTWLGSLALGWFVATGLGDYSEVVWAGEQGFEKRSIWGRNRASWSDVRAVVFEDISERIRKQSSRRAGQVTDSTIQDIKVWSIRDGSGKEIVSLDIESRTSGELEKFLARARQAAAEQ